MLRDEVDKIVDVAELIVDAAVPLSYAGKDAFGDAAVRHCADCKGKHDAASRFGREKRFRKGSQKQGYMVKNRADQKN
jgi:hypothetical protein